MRQLVTAPPAVPFRDRPRRIGPASSPLCDLCEYTTGQVAAVLGCSPRTVAKYCQSGLLDHYRLPQSVDRRVPRDSLAAFLVAGGLSRLLPRIGFRPESVAVGVECAVPGELPEGWSRRRCDYATAVIAAATDPSVALVVVSGSVGRAMATEFAAAVRDARPSSPPRLVFAAAADYWDAATPEGFDAAVAEPIDPAELWSFAAPADGGDS